jgi:hypothetical protein
MNAPPTASSVVSPIMVISKGFTLQSVCVVPATVNAKKGNCVFQIHPNEMSQDMLRYG